MSTAKIVPIEIGREVQARCLCFHTQRAARALARRFDTAFQQFGITNGQFSLMMMLNNAGNPRIGQVAEFLAMDRTTLTAALKSLERRGLVTVVRDPDDGRSRRLSLTNAGAKILKSAVPVWRSEHARLEEELPDVDVGKLRASLRAVA